MVVSFNSFNVLETPQLILCNPWCVYSSGTTTNAIGELPSVSNVEATYNFNAMSELAFRVHGTSFDDSNKDEYIRQMCDMVAVNRYIFIPAIGYFIITSADRTAEFDDIYKDVTAKSVEMELERRGIPYIANGTYKLKKQAGDADNGILDLMATQLAGWTIGDIDDSLAALYRTFTDVSIKTNVYEFLTKNIQEAYECIVLFDILTRTINFYDKSTYVVETDIHLTMKDWVNKITLQEDSEKIYTALNTLTTESFSSSFDENITVAAVNPTGSSILYDFSLYTSWMSSALGTKVAQWQAAVDTSAPAFYTAAVSYYEKLEEKLGYDADEQKYQTYVDIYDQCITNMTAAQSNTDQIVLVAASANEALTASGGTEVSIKDTISNTIAGVQALKSAAESEVTTAAAASAAAEALADTYKGMMDAAVNQFKMSAYFTSTELQELSYYIFEGTYDDPYIKATESMTVSQRLALMRLLYQRTRSKLNQISTASKKIVVDTNSFIFEQKFADWSQQLVTGCLINVETTPDVTEQLFLTSIRVNYEEKTSDLTFGNKLERLDVKAMFDDVLQNISRSANTAVFM